MTLGLEKLEWCGYQTVKKFDATFIRFDRIHESDRQTDRQTPHDDIGRACIASRGKNKSSTLEVAPSQQQVKVSQRKYMAVAMHAPLHTFAREISSQTASGSK